MCAAFTWFYVFCIILHALIFAYSLHADAWVLFFFCLFMVVLCLCHYWCLFVLGVFVFFLCLFEVFLFLLWFVSIYGICRLLWCFLFSLMYISRWDLGSPGFPGVPAWISSGFSGFLPQLCLFGVDAKWMKNFRAQNKKMREKCFEWSVRAEKHLMRSYDVFSLCQSETLDSSLRGFF